MNIALIIGCARSGTSILGELIGSHPEIRYKHEAHAVWEKAGLGEHDSHRLTEQHATRRVTRKIRRKFAQEQGEARLLVEKCPRNVLRIPFIQAVFPEAKIIHIMRDGRDVACSMIPGIGRNVWQHLKPPNWQILMQHETGVMRCAHAWKTIMEIALQDLTEVQHLSLKYENLVQEPGCVAQEIFQFLELPVHPDVLHFCQRIQNSTGDSYHAQRQVKWYQDDHQVRIGRWRENLSDDEAQAVEDVLRPLLMKLGYPCAS